jgi:DNA-binding MarR family transcriptional regulator
MARRARLQQPQKKKEIEEQTFEPLEGLFDRRSSMKNLMLLMEFFAANLDKRVTANQILAFVYFANFDVIGDPKTLNDLREMKTFKNMITRSLDVFLAPEKESDEEMVDWLYRETSNSDNRKKYIRLTEKGKEACKMLFAFVR